MSTFDLEKARPIIDRILRLAVDIQIHHDGFMLAWRDKFEPKGLAELDKLRKELFEVTKEWRKVNAS
jgi:hypothetical protein